MSFAHKNENAVKLPHERITIEDEATMNVMSIGFFRVITITGVDIFIDSIEIHQARMFVPVESIHSVEKFTFGQTNHLYGPEFKKPRCDFFLRRN